MEPRRDRLPTIALKTLDGGALTLPTDGADELTLLAFVEPPADPNAEFPVKLGGTRPEGKRRGRAGVMQYAFEMADRHIHKKVKVVAAFLCDDAERVRALMKRIEWPCQAAVVPDGLANPLVE